MTHKSQKKKKPGGSPNMDGNLNRETENEPRYRELFELESDAVLLIDNETGNILEANHAAIALYGYCREELLARKNTDLSAEPEQTEKITRQTAADKNQVVHIPIRYHRKKDGSIFPCEITGRFFLHQGKSVHIAAIRDITERKLAEKALYSSQTMLQTVLDTIPAAVFWKDRNFRYLGGNRTWLDAIGIKSSEEVVGKSDYDLPWEQGEADSFREDDKKVMESGIAENNIVEPYLRADGTHAWARTNKVPLLDAGGNVIGVLGTYEDITERKRMEEELYKAQKLESLGMLAGGIAHDFNNLLTGIFSHIDLARAASKEVVVSNYLSTALGAIERARNLTGQLLTFAKGGAPVLETGDLPPVIRNSSKLALSGSNVSCVLNIPDGLWPCNFDRNQIGQVIDNMVINARAAMPAGGAVLISAMNIALNNGENGTLRAGNYVTISIHDDGTGIPADVLPKIFDPFFTTKQAGSGLGLAICHSIVKRHGGWIDVESAPGKGTTFHLYLPASRKTAAHMPPQKTASFHKGSGRILIMDDEEIIRQSVAKTLEILGYSVESRRNGKETLAFLAEEIRAGRSFSAILLDLTVPGGMGGKEVAVEIRNMNITIPLFVTSGYSNDPVMSNPINYGFAGSICKPFTIDDLAAMLNRHLQKNP